MNASHTTSFDLEDWGGYAICYDALNELLPYRQLQEDVAEKLGTLRGQKVLEAACGTGNLTQILLQKLGGQETEITAIDFSEEMLSRARQKCTRGNAHFLRADLNKPLPFKSECFDHVVSINTLYALRDPKAVLGEFFRVLKNGGTLVLATPKKGYENGLILKEHCGSTKPDIHWLNAHVSPQREWELIKEALGDTESARRMMAVAQYNREILSQTAFHFFDAAELRFLVQENGFIITEVGTAQARQGIMVIAIKRGKT